MKITREIIQGIVEEEIEEAKLRKKVREKVRTVVKSREEKRAARKILSSIDNILQRAIGKVSEEHKGLIEDLRKLKNELSSIKEKYGVE